MPILLLAEIHAYWMVQMNDHLKQNIASVSMIQWNSVCIGWLLLSQNICILAATLKKRGLIPTGVTDPRYH